jgi:hypothetical protein
LDHIEDIDNSLDPQELADLNKVPSFIVHYYSNNKLRWDLLIIIFAIYNSIVTPLEIAFEPPFSKSVWFRVLDLLLNAFYIADIGVNFRTTYIDEGGEEIVAPCKIAVNYV